MDMYATWAPDDDRIVFNSDLTGRYELYVSERTGAGWSEPTPLTTNGGVWGDWSPDGMQVVYAADPGIASIDVASGRERILLQSFERDGVYFEPTYPRWTPDGRSIIVKATDPDGYASFWSIPAEGGTPRLLVTFDDPSRPFGRPELATDGQRVYFTIDNRQSDIWVMEVLQGG
jgi:Tol biopolymer transport system component